MLGDVPLRKLSPTAINAFNAALRSQPRKPRRPRRGTKKRPEAGDAPEDAESTAPTPKPLSEGTRRHIYVTLVTALNAAVAQGLLAVNPTTRATAPQRHDTRELHTWSAQQLRVFLETTREDRLHALWRWYAMTGMRRGEALGLKWPDVDFAGARVSIQRSRVHRRRPGARAPTQDAHRPTGGASRRCDPGDAADLEGPPGRRAAGLGTGLGQTAATSLRARTASPCIPGL